MQNNKWLGNKWLGKKTNIMKKRYVWFLMVLLLLMGGLTLSACSKDNIDSEEEENLGASRPIVNMLSDLSDPNASVSWTLWESHSLFGYIMKMDFDYKECTYTIQRSGSDNTIEKYTYNFNYPTITLTSTNEEKEVIIGTITSDRIRADVISFKNSKNEAVWM